MSEMTSEEFDADIDEKASNIAKYGDYDIESEQDAAKDSALESLENNSRTTYSDQEQQDMVESSLNDDVLAQYTSDGMPPKTDEEMNEAVIDASIDDMYPGPMYEQSTDEEQNDAVIDSLMQEELDKNKESDYNKPVSDDELYEQVKETARSTDIISEYRVRINAPTGLENDIYGPMNPDNILSILYSTGGILFHYTPSITEEHSMEYKQMAMVSSNQDYYSYTNTAAPIISITGKFVTQNQMHGKYCLAIIHFMRTLTKSHFGKLDQNAGSPPPIMELNGYGRYMYNKVPVIIKGHNITFADNVDYVEVYDNQNNKTKIPIEFDLTLNLVVQNTPKRWREEFNLDDFRTGKLMRQQSGWI